MSCWCYILTNVLCYFLFFSQCFCDLDISKEYKIKCESGDCNGFLVPQQPRSTIHIPFLRTMISVARAAKWKMVKNTNNPNYHNCYYLRNNGRGMFPQKFWSHQPLAIEDINNRKKEISFQIYMKGGCYKLKVCGRPTSFLGIRTPKSLNDKRFARIVNFEWKSCWGFVPVN